MASKQEEQEAPTTLPPCHIIRLAYPAYNYDDDAFSLPQGSRVMRPILIAPANVSERHELLGLVEYRQGDDRTLYDATDRASFAYVTNTDQLAARHRFSDGMLASAAAFVQDVRDASSFVGSTAILIDTVVVPDQQGKRTKTLLIERSTVFERPRNAAFPQGDLTASRSSKLVLPVLANLLPSALCSEQRSADIGNLINRTTDHAVRHVHLSMSREGVREPGTYSWKLRRCSTLEKLIDEQYAPVATSELRFVHDRCTICLGGFDEKDHLPMRRRNTGFSTTGRNCLIDELQRTSSCGDNGILDEDPALMLAELERGTFTVEMPRDASYSEWEMLERGYADLDREPVRGDPDVVTMDGAFLIAAWN
ncbi:unnamed protein product [Zymoseptoria tritici ST99CH_1A5]|uniref:Uncharacterized protein n=1 Tax=Zymoseptoria tritici ST99CH_1A5 TaxID=1276529 RepID=A0A1Y6L447_ZYMTR|nr:unnamed protein product [Zymoseptoria tritici ST99CH_1A5]